jgi:hypothetical protein
MKKIIKISMILIVIAFVSSCDLLSSRVIFQDGDIDEERARSIIALLQKNLHQGEKEPYYIAYIKYPVISKSFFTRKTNCVTFAFAFATLYGYPCTISMSTNHCFVKINGKIIEPNQPNYSTYDSIFDFRIPGASYDSMDIFNVEEIDHSDKERVRNYFYK